jgi:hypothetical protein
LTNLKHRATPRVFLEKKAVMQKRAGQLAVSAKIMDDLLHVQEEKNDIQKTMSTSLLAV